MYQTKRKIKKAFTPITIANTPYTKNKDQIQINNIEAEIEETERLHQKGAMIRSRTKLIENEEKPIKFFYTAGKQNQNKKHITQLKNKKEELKKKDEEILKIARDFYSELYTKAQIKKQEQGNFLSSYDRKISIDWHPNLTNRLKKKNCSKH